MRAPYERGVRRPSESPTDGRKQVRPVLFSPIGRPDDRSGRRYRSTHGCTHRRRGPHADRQAVGRAGRALGAMDLGGFAIKARPRAGRRAARRRSTTCSWARCCRPARARSPARQAAVKAGIPMTRARHHRQQGVPVGPQHHLPGRPDDRRRRRRHRGGRRHGVDDQRARTSLPGARAGYRFGDATLRRLDDVRRPVLRLRHVRHGRRHRAATTGEAADHPRAARTPSPRCRTSGPRPPSRTGRLADEIVAGVGAPAQGRPDRGRAPTRASGPAPPPSRLGRAAAGLRQGRHHHRRQRQPDLRRRRRRHRDVAGRGRAPRASRRSARSSATARSPAPTRRCCTSRPAAIAQALRRPGSTLGDVDLFEFNEAFAAVGLASMARPRHHRRRHQRQRRRHRPRPPHRHVGHPPRPHRRSTSCGAAAAASAPPPSAAAAARATR